MVFIVHVFGMRSLFILDSSLETPFIKWISFVKRYDLGALWSQH